MGRRGRVFRGYRLVWRLLAPIALVFNAWQAVRAGDSRLFWQRLGLSLPGGDDTPVWLHAASVGELIAALPLVSALRQRFPQLPVVVTTVTPTGARVAAERLPPEVQHCYLPMDLPGATKRFALALKPRAALIMETELWPMLFFRMAEAGIPLVIVNGRLSRRTLDTHGWVKRLYASCLRSVTRVLARSEADAEAYRWLGMPAERVETLGNVKFSPLPAGRKIVPVDFRRSFILAASTHEDEEYQIADQWRRIEHGECLLVIAPRHPERREAILRRLRPLSLNIAVRSRDDPVTAGTDIYLIDTLGELEHFMASAMLVFVGGSLVARGGHNVLEPARLGKAVLFGPWMDNFEEESRLLLEAGAACQVADVTSLGDVLERMLSRPEKVEAMGRVAQRVMEKQEEVLHRYLDAIIRYCELDCD